MCHEARLPGETPPQRLLEVLTPHPAIREEEDLRMALERADVGKKWTLSLSMRHVARTGFVNGLPNGHRERRRQE